MVDSVDTSSSMTLARSSEMKPSKVSEGNKSASKLGDQASKPAGVLIAEVANEASSERDGTLASLEKTADELREAIHTLNATLEKSPTKAVITRDESLKRWIVKIHDESSGEIVREIPSEALLKFARNLQELKGLIFDTSL